MEGTRKLLVEKISEVTNLGDAKESIRDFLLQVLLLVPHFLENIMGFLAEKVIQVLLSIRDFLLQILLLIPHLLENTWVFLAEKLNHVLPSIRDFLLQILLLLPHLLENTWGFLAEKLNQVPHLLENTWGFLAEKVNQVLPPQIRSLLLQKLHLLLHLLENTWVFLAEKLNQVLPPETRSHWVHVGLTLVLPIALSLLCLYCCYKYRLYNCCRSAGRGAGKMMKAPGRSGAVMPRALFEWNPRVYFLALRANKPLLF